MEFSNIFYKARESTNTSHIPIHTNVRICTLVCGFASDCAEHTLYVQFVCPAVPFNGHFDLPTSCLYDIWIPLWGF